LSSLIEALSAAHKTFKIDDRQTATNSAKQDFSFWPANDSSMSDFTYRLSQIPETFTENDIRQLFPKNVGEVTAISAAPSISENSGCQVATLTFRNEPTFDKSLSQLGGECFLSHLIREGTPDDGVVEIRIDNNFYGLTPLHSPNPEEIIVE
jgi:hypothetical protein